MTIATKNICPRCGNAFECGAKNAEPESCWCMRLPPLPVPVDAQMSCLCPHCLQALADELKISRERRT